MSENVLYYGNNLDILPRYIKDESVDLIYLDPPFKSDQDYNVLFAEKNGSQSKAQIKAFEDTWQWDQGAAETYQDIVEHGPEQVSKAMQAFRMFIGENDMLAYLSMMAPRLVELHRVLKSPGTIYLHCDPTASHYLKTLMDAVFGVRNFINEIVWKKIRSPKGQTRGFGNVHDVILLFSKSEKTRFNRQYVSLSEKRIKQHYSNIEEQTGRRYMLDNFTQAGSGPARRFGDKWLEPPSGKHWIWGQDRIDEGFTRGRFVFTSPTMVRVKRYLDKSKGKPVDDIWNDIAPLNAQAAERLGYPTQKPEALLERIVQASSNEGETVLDPFCGCGTTISVAQRLNRKWVGIDITHLAITLIKNRLHDAFGDTAKYDVVGEPISLPDAEALAQADPYQFQWWALGLVGARPTEQKKGADKGIDGRIYFHDEAKGGKTKQIILQVKGGYVTASQIRDLRGVVERENAEIGVFITLSKPTRPMQKEAASGGFYDSPGWSSRHPRLQILTVKDLLEGNGIDYPAPLSTDRTFKKAPRAKVRDEKQQDLF